VPGAVWTNQIGLHGEDTESCQSDVTLRSAACCSPPRAAGPSPANRTTPGPVPGLSDVVSVSAGGHHSVALRSDGSVVAFGHNGAGQLGDGTNEQRSTPVAVSGLTDVKAVVAGYDHNVALLRDGTVASWGFNRYGALGDGTDTSRNQPVAVTGLSGVLAVAAGWQHSLAVKAG